MSYLSKNLGCAINSHSINTRHYMNHVQNIHLEGAFLGIF